jgi:hypothetical protein
MTTRSRTEGKASAAVILCGALIIAFMAIAWTAVSGKSATWDEPSHTATGWLMLWRHDYRLSPDVPPLWEYWIALANGPDKLHFDDTAPGYQHLLVKGALFHWSITALYRTPGNDGIAMVNRSRVMALVLGAALAALIARWAWKLGGSAATVSATFLYCLDPNFLGHAPLVKNDVGFTLVYFAAAFALWRVGRRMTALNVASLVLLTAAAVAVKLSGVLLAPVLVIALAVRAVLPQPWPILSRNVTSRLTKLAAVAAVCVLAAVTTFAALWACYGFRYNAGPGGLTCDMDYSINALRTMQVMVKDNGQTPAADLAAWRMPLSTRAVVFMDKHHLLPQAWTVGFVMTQLSSEGRGAYLCGTIYSGGRWFYFPLAAAFKEPLATLAAVLLAGLIGRSAIKRGLLRDPDHRWTAIAMGVPAFVYGAALLTANMNIGLRHAFPVYPFIFVGVSLVVAKVWNGSQSRRARIVILILGAALVAETSAAFPDYIAFFNAICAPYRLSLLADSNLDWGQDLPLLAAWQRQHPDTTLYLDYFGECDPAAYGIKYVNVPIGYTDGPTPVLPTKPGVVAVSATDYQQVYNNDPWPLLFARRTPEAVLGHSIYLFALTKADISGPEAPHTNSP